MTMSNEDDYHVCEVAYLLGNPDKPLRHVLDGSCGNFCQTSSETLDGISLFVKEDGPMIATATACA